MMSGMRRESQVAVAIVVAVCVLAGFASPLVPTPLTTLRSHHGLTALPGIASLGPVAPLPLAAGASYLPEFRSAWRPSGAELIAFTCVRLC